MNGIAKTMAFWILLLVLAILVYNVFSRPSRGRETEIAFSRFLEELDNKNVTSAKIIDSDLTGQFRSGGTFKTIIPTDYPALYDKLQGVNVEIEHSAPNPWLAALMSWAPFLLILGFWIFVMRQMKKRGAQQNTSAAGTNSSSGNMVQLEADVAKEFPDSQSVNDALRLVIQLKHIPGTA